MIFVVIFFMGVLILSLIPLKNQSKSNVYVKPADKHCPPHEWYFKEIKDGDGVVQAERITCRRCGPPNGDGSVV